MMSVRAPESPRTMAGYEFGLLLEQSFGHVTHTKNLLTNVALDCEVHAHWSLLVKMFWPLLSDATLVSARIAF
jgi:hypothetical protein